MISIEWVQHPVGHGGFHTGRAKACDGTLFTWVFDCGSRRKRGISDDLNEWIKAHPQPIDWLFISHFDLDHVSGLDPLMAQVKVRDVMVPYVNDYELAYALLEEISQDRVEHWFTELTADPAAYLLSRGAEHVAFLGSPEGGPLDISDSDPPKREGGKGERGWNIINNLGQEDIVSLRRFRGVEKTKSVRWIKRQSCNFVASNHCCDELSIVLKPYRAPIELDSRGNLLKRIKKDLNIAVKIRNRPGLGDFAYQIAEVARNVDGRRKLRDIFADNVGSSNRASLSLLSMVEVGSDIIGDLCINNRRERCHSKRVAWVNTGDAELLKSQDLNCWSQCYVNELPNVRVLVLPHHGSDDNSDVSLQQKCKNATLIAAVKAGARKHPGSMVAGVAGERLFCVTEHATSKFCQEFTWP